MKLRSIYSGSEVEELIRQARAGDRNARGRLWESFRENLHRHCHWKTPSRLHAKMADEDLVQEMIATAEQAFAKFRGNSAKELETWFHGIARNVINGLCRQYHCRKRDVAREVPLDAFGENGELLPDRPEREHLTEEEIKQVKLAINRLGRGSLYVIWFHDYFKINFDQLAGEFHCSPSSVRRMHEQALIRLGKVIRESELAERYRMA